MRGGGNVRGPFRRISAAVAVLIGAGALAPPAGAATTQVARVSASVLKPLTLESIQDLDLGTIVIGAGTWSGAQVAISQAGALSCANPNVTCTGATQVAQYNLSGSNSQTVRVSVPDVILTNQSDATKSLTLVPDAPATVDLPNSGNKGVTFAVGGSVTVSSSTADGVYSGTFSVTVDYQ
jgi:hypothetical protein